jgi:hypothetical protein
MAIRDIVMSTLRVAHWSNRVRAALLACEHWAARAPLRFALLAVLALLAIAFVVLQPSYDTNDDVFMTMIVSGQSFCPAPDEHLIFSNVLIGHALTQLYTTWPHFPWYGCYLLLIHYLAQVSLLYCALKSGPESVAGGTRRRLALYLIYFVVVELLFFNSLQFTTTAFLAAQAGIFLLLLAVRRRTSQVEATVAWPLGTAGLMLLVAGLVRLESLWMALLVAAPLAFSLARQASRRALVAGGIATATAAILIVSATAYDRISYRHDPRWSGFFDYNQLRVKFNDYQWTFYSPQTAHVFQAVGWTKNDHEMIAHWFFDDPAVYSEQHLRAILQAYPWKTERLTPAYFWQIGRGMLRDRSVWAVMLVLPFFFAGIDRRSQPRWAIIGCAIVGIGLVALITWNNKLPPARVYFPLLSFPLAAALLLSASSANASPLRVEQTTKAGGRLRQAVITWRTRPPRTRAVLVLLVVGIGMGSHHQCRRSLLVHRDRRALQTFLDELRPDGRNLYVCWGATMPFELASPLDTLASRSQMPMLNLVWTQRTPWQEHIKAQHEISNLAQAIYQRDDIVLVAAPADQALFATFAKEHFQTDVEFVPSSSAGQKLVAGRFQRRVQPSETAGTRSDAQRR